MQQILLDAVPNQSLTVQLDGLIYDLVFKFTVNVMSVTISRNDVLIESGARVVAGTPLLPYAYQEDGNFVFLTANDDLPDYTQFGITQVLIYASQVELNAISAEQARIEALDAGT